MVERLQEFTKSSSRNHLEFSNGSIEGLSYFDIGLELSSFIEGILGDRRLSFRTQDKLNALLREHTLLSPIIGQYLALTNIGILFEPSLKIDVEGLFDRWSQNNVLVINIGKGAICSNRLFLTPNCPEQYSVSLQRINYTII
ncbi:MAG: hypothetical protein IJV36_02610 [Prevotella sp.]|nr:hypothetical protein [Prevotella sp.]